MSISSSGHFVEVTPDDDNDLPDGVTRGILVGVAGTIDAISERDDETTLTLAAGVIHPFRIKRVLETSTATNIVAVY